MNSPRSTVPGSTLGFVISYVVVVLLFLPQTLMAQKVAVTTREYNNFRSGWNNNETTLTPANVASSSFGILYSIPLDTQVDAQPLVVPNEQITVGNYQGQHDVVYVATEGNTIYAIDANTGTVLLNPNLGAPVVEPLGCEVNPVVGIGSTPVIDLAANTMYVIVYTSESNGPVYRIHALDLGSLTDKITPVVVAASHTLSDGSTYNFNPAYQHQRPALLLANGDVYAAFGSFCDNGVNISRGWLLGWQASSLTPLVGNQLMDTQASDSDEFFLSSVWMSGAGPAADASGNVYFVTGNSDPAGNTYDGVTDLQESVIKESADLTQVLDLFTPSDWGLLDKGDFEIGSGGIMLLPPSPVKTPPLEPAVNLAVAAGKDGNMFLMNQDDLGGYDPNNDNVIGVFPIGGCFCVASYFVDPSDQIPRVVTNGGASVEIWKLQTTPTITLTNLTKSAALFGRHHGAFTTVSSNGTSNPIIWAVATLNWSTPQLGVYAFDPEASGSTLLQIFSNTTFGTWPYKGDVNQVPVVANGEVFVASGQELTIFGLTSGKKPVHQPASRVP
jgi:hypothetical protein